jgi:hypothetical protein
VAEVGAAAREIEEIEEVFVVDGGMTAGVVAIADAEMRVVGEATIVVGVTAGEAMGREAIEDAGFTIVEDTMEEEVGDGITPETAVPVHNGINSNKTETTLPLLQRRASTSSIRAKIRSKARVTKTSNISHLNLTLLRYRCRSSLDSLVSSSNSQLQPARADGSNLQDSRSFHSFPCHSSSYHSLAYHQSRRWLRRLFRLELTSIPVFLVVNKTLHLRNNLIPKFQLGCRAMGYSNNKIISHHNPTVMKRSRLCRIH